MKKAAEEGPNILAESAGHDCETDPEYFDQLLFVEQVASTKEINTVPQEEQALWIAWQYIRGHLISFQVLAVIDTHNVSLLHIQGSEGLNSTSTSLKSSPDIAIKRTGPIFGPDVAILDNQGKQRKETTAKKEFLDYRLCVCPVEVKTEANRRYSENLAQIGVYIR